MVKEFSRSIAVWLILGLMFLLLFNLFQKPHPKEPEIIFSDFVTAVKNGEIAEVLIQGKTIRGKYRNGSGFETLAPEYPELVNSLIEKGVRITAAKPDEGDPWFVVLLVQWFPMLLLVGVWIFFMRKMQRGGGTKDK